MLTMNDVMYIDEYKNKIRNWLNYIFLEKREGVQPQIYTDIYTLVYNFTLYINLKRLSVIDLNQIVLEHFNTIKSSCLIPSINQIKLVKGLFSYLYKYPGVSTEDRLDIVIMLYQYRVTTHYLEKISNIWLIPIEITEEIMLNL